MVSEIIRVGGRLWGYRPLGRMGVRLVATFGEEGGAQVRSRAVLALGRRNLSIAKSEVQSSH